MPVRILAIYTDEPLEVGHKTEGGKPVFVLPEDHYIVDLTDELLSFGNQSYDPNQVPRLDISDLFKFDYKVDLVIGREVIDLTEE